MTEREIELQKEVERLTRKLAAIHDLADHSIPYYSYGDNEAANEMGDRLKQIYIITQPKGDTL